MSESIPIDAVRPQPVIELRIRWTPGLGKLEMAWPNVDDTIKFGLLEVAKAALIEARIKSAIGRPDAGLIVPATLAPKVS